MPEKEPVTNNQEIGRIGNYYGGLTIAKIGDKYGWIIENYDSNLEDSESFEIIPEYLYDALIKFESERRK